MVDQEGENAGTDLPQPFDSTAIPSVLSETLVLEYVEQYSEYSLHLLRSSIYSLSSAIEITKNKGFGCTHKETPNKPERKLDRSH